MNSAKEATQPFYERRLFQGTAAVVALATAVLALVGPLRDAIDGVSPDPSPRSAWTEVVLNTSAAMGERFGRGDETAFESALHALEESVGPLDSHGVGLQRTAASCGEDSKKLVDVATGSADRVIEEAREQTPDGRASIVDAVRAAVAELEREPMQSHPPKSKSLFVFTTETPPCEWDDLFEEEVRSKLAKIKDYGAVEVFALELQPEQEMVAYGELAGEGSDELDVLEDALGPETTIHYVETPDELYEEAKAASETVREAADEARENEGGGPTGLGTSDEGAGE